MGKQTRQFVSAGDLADIFDVTAARIRRWARDGRIPCLFLPDGRPVFDPGEVIDALKRDSRKAG